MPEAQPQAPRRSSRAGQGKVSGSLMVSKREILNVTPDSRLLQ